MFASMSPPNPRKRAAPGAIPAVQIPTTVQQYQSPYATPLDQVSRWNGAEVYATDPITPGPKNIPQFNMTEPHSSYPNATTHQSYQHQAIATPGPTNAIARRPAGSSRALVTRQQYDGLSTEPWPSFGDETALMPASGVVNPLDENDNIALLEERAARAKRDAQANRKQIPPFVQKLGSFLNEEKNTDLIRWSQKGDSFIVLDEDEFAKTLIPELFKHNNYASFVRQLNMYGFHKRVGLSDNSMKASERKNKSPSEYYNPYFKRGHPNLLWLINKPKSGNSKKRSAKNNDGAEVESDEDATPTVEDINGAGYVGAAQNSSRSGGPAQGDPGSQALQKKDFQVVKDQLNQLQTQQRAISNMIQRLRSDHTALYNQALAFQNMHERHENSINAILNFLANVFRKSLEEQGGNSNHTMQDLLASIIPNGGSGSQMHKGSVVDLGDFVQQQSVDHSNVADNTPKRGQRLLLPSRGGRASATSTAAKSPSASYATSPRGQMGSVTELFDNSPNEVTSPPDYLSNDLRQSPQQMMRIIDATNAAGATADIDLPDIAAKTPVTLSSDQRNQMLNLMASQATAPQSTSSIPATASPLPATTTATSPQPIPAMQQRQQQHRATPPPVPAQAASGMVSSPVNSALGASPPRSLSPLMSSMPPPPSLHDITMTQEELDSLQRLQDEQKHKIDEISHFLAPLSPSGRVPGVDEAGNPTTVSPEASGSYFPDMTDNMDIEQFLDSSAFGAFDASGTGGSADDFNFSLDANYDGSTPVAAYSLAAPITESHSNTPSSAATEEYVIRKDFAENDGSAVGPDAKRRRMG
ncbi:hypothetical protein MCOR27_003032 [Pyricularia oryzae]|uniref:HSF-type DNA-binding domain-containing protein n=2 Tax=Pyricularia TaxID=48558 RepID=A0ABQ8NAZ3_PYRGI|nr:hypothetical protein MCOR01_004630 [Pyricularia oryzae]KAI6294212.1 hypothetical protein MCOR33_008637 [Pyricularia grisea]KAH9431323.1 hypothetical protein MCOR02_008619 [Pyricularia oryzae]KAI6254823.1 hypothetical protein MCOR19_008658 [Pyricularia oryzae]KAI6283956.1 hypothetical protein MCOR27_003032 [Pyricularia oryzae]